MARKCSLVVKPSSPNTHSKQTEVLRPIPRGGELAEGEALEEELIRGGVREAHVWWIRDEDFSALNSALVNNSSN